MQVIQLAVVFTGPAQALEIIGDHAYAYSGAVALDDTTNENTYIKFTSGNYYFVGTMQSNNLDEGAGTDDMVNFVYFNGIQVQGYRVGSSNIYTSPDNLIPLIIPPYTEVEITIKDLTQASTIKNVVSLTGRIYRTRD